MLNILSFYVALEAILGGGGGFYKFFGYPSRLYLLILALVPLYERFNNNKSKHLFEAVKLSSCFLIFYVIHLFIAELFIRFDLGDLQQLLYLFIAAMGIFTIYSSQHRFLNFIKCLYIGTFVLAVLHILLTIGLSYGFVEFAYLQSISLSSGEIFFRSTNFFFYKGSYYLPLGILAIYLKLLPFRRPSLSIIYTIVVTTSILLTLTRSLIVGLIACLAIILLKRASFKFLTLLVTFSAVFLKIIFNIRNFMFDNQSNSSILSGTAIRLRDNFIVLDEVNALTLFFGNGFGALIGDRLLIENSLLLILYKSGLFGVVLLSIPAFVCLLKIFSPKVDDLSLFLCVGTIYFYIVSLFNPVITNSIGLFWLLVTLSFLSYKKNIANPT